MKKNRISAIGRRCLAVVATTLVLIPFGANAHQPPTEEQTPPPTPASDAKEVIVYDEEEMPFQDDGARADAHAPISVMNDHMHEAGEWMVSTRYMFMDMNGMRNHATNVSSQTVFDNNYIVSPTRMTMNMAMLGIMYAPTDWLTLMAMGSYITKEMDHVISPMAAPLIGFNNGARNFTTRSDGLGDLKLTGLFRLLEKNGWNAHAGLGLSFPLGNIWERDQVPGPGGRQSRLLPPAMQIGSGTWDLLPSLTVSKQGDWWSTGLQGYGVVRLGTNGRGYRLGNVAGADYWFSVAPAPWVSLSALATYRWEGQLEGTPSGVLRNPPFAPSKRTVTTAFGENYGGHRLDLGTGINFYIPSGFLQGNRLAVDVRFPVWQNLNGFQLETDWLLTAGWQLAF